MIQSIAGSLFIWSLRDRQAHANIGEHTLTQSSEPKGGGSNPCWRAIDSPHPRLEGITLFNLLRKLLGLAATQSASKLEPRSVMDEEEEVNHAWLDLAGIPPKHPWGIGKHDFVTLMHEWADWEIAAESPHELAEEEIDAMFEQITTATELGSSDMALTDFSLLAVVEGLIPPPEGIALLRRVFGDQFADSVLARSASRA